VSADLERDLGAWSRGELTRARLLEAHGAPAAGCVALHERLVGVAASTRISDPEAGWAALLEKIEAPAPVVPLRPHVRHRRTVSLLVAAAVVLGGSAFAAIWIGTDHGAVPSPTATGVTVGRGSSLPGPTDRRLVPPPSRSTNEPAGTSRPDAGSSGGEAEGPRRPGDTSGGGGAPSVDDPRDRDRGTGNDGSHDDHGSGNDGRSGTLPHAAHGGH
jgi:hypothetical protein